MDAFVYWSRVLDVKVQVTPDRTFRMVSKPQLTHKVPTKVRRAFAEAPGRLSTSSSTRSTLAAEQLFRYRKQQPGVIGADIRAEGQPVI